jgi:ubiquinone/menaquinone biosynthesis C-methylase UbiE
MLKQQQNIQVRRVAANAQNLPFYASIFDRIASGFVITHLPDLHASFHPMSSFQFGVI